MEVKETVRSISIIGTGNVGWHFNSALRNAGFDIKHIIYRNFSQVQGMNIVSDTETLSSIQQIKEEPDLYLICTQDDEIEALAKALSSSGAIVAHTSGGVGMEVFREKASKYGVFYPLQTFTRGDVVDYKAIPFLVEGSDPKTEIALQGIAQKISGIHHLLDSQARLKVHLAAVFACNFSNHMATIASKLLEEMDLSIELIKPLMEQSMKKLQTMSPVLAQTGPAIRGDEISMQHHLDLLSADPDLQDLYRMISQSIAKEKYTENNE